MAKSTQEAAAPGTGGAATSSNTAPEKAIGGANDPLQDPAAMAAPPIEGPAALVFAKRAMWRAGRSWNAGSNPLTLDQVKALGEKGMTALTADPNFSLVGDGMGGAILATSVEDRIVAHTVVMAKRAMWRGGRSWNAGATPFDEEQAATVLTPAVVMALQADPNFSVVGAAAKAEAAPTA